MLPEEKFTTSNGVITNAIYGVATMIIKLVADMEKKYKQIHVICAFDSPTCNTRRVEVYKDYKAQRAKAPQGLRHQFGLVRILIEAMNIESYDIENAEADDIIATIVAKNNEKYNQVVICSPDKDYSQLLVYPNVQQYDTKKKIFITADDIIDKYQIDPSRFIKYQALVGDKCDNVPGCNGIGPKTAVKLLNYNRTIEELVETPPDEIKKIVAKIDLSMYNISKTLVTLNTNLDFNIDKVYKCNIFNEKFKEFCETYEFTSILKKFKK
jgi:DNA polymerase-1